MGDLLWPLEKGLTKSCERSESNQDFENLIILGSFSRCQNGKLRVFVSVSRFVFLEN